MTHPTVDNNFQRWREAQLALQQAEQRLTLASSPASAGFAGGTTQELQVQVSELRVAADEALAKCLAEADRSRRVHHSVGIHTLDGRTSR